MNLVKEGIQMIQGAIFDLDGLLLDTERIYEDAWIKYGPKYGFGDSTFLAETFCGMSKDKIIHTLNKYHVEATEYLKDVIQYVSKHELTDLHVKPGVNEILSFFQSKGIGCAVASSSPKNLILRNLKIVGLDSYFDEIVSGDEVEHGKPAPDIFLEAAHRLNVDPKHCFVFEDAINGVHAGLSAGCKTIMIPDRLKPEKDFYKTTYGIFDNLHVAMNQIKCMME
jgi:HAD superfamily hydrolase (TIGR01509 family)